MRTPSENELLGDGYAVRPAGDLLPERGVNVNAGLLFDWDIPTGMLSVEVNGFYNHLWDMIRIQQSYTTSAYINHGEMRTLGGEIEVKADATRWLYLYANTTYQDLRDTRKFLPESRIKNFTEGKRMPNIPYFLANGGLELHREDLFGLKNTNWRLFGDAVFTEGFFYDFEMSKMQVVDLEKFGKAGEIDLTPYAAQGTGLSYPQAGFPLVAEGKVYFPLWQVDGRRLPKDKPGVDILVLDANTDKELDHITSPASGLSGPAYPYGQNGFVDEKGDIYFICGGAFGTSSQYKDGIIRIKKGENKIDETYNWVLDDEKFDGHAIDWVLGGLYLGNGKYCLQVSRTDLKVSDPKESYMKDRCIVLAVLDIYNKTVVQMAPSSTAHHRLRLVHQPFRW